MGIFLFKVFFIQTKTKMTENEKMSDDFEQFEQQEKGDGTSFGYLGDCKKGTYVVVDGTRPCKVVSLTTAKVGKHGSAKGKVVAQDIFDGSKHEVLGPVSMQVQVPEVTRVAYTWVDISDDRYVSLMNMEDYTMRNDIKCPNLTADEEAKLTEGFEAGHTITATVISSLNKSAITEWNIKVE